MHLRRFYGRTVTGTIALVRRDLGPDALILETNPVAPGSPAARMNPGARYEIVAARDPNLPAPAAAKTSPSARLAAATPAAGRDLLHDLGLLRSQVQHLFDEECIGGPSEAGAAQVAQYRELIELGVDPKVLAPHFRAWLRWRTSPAPLRQYIAKTNDGPAREMIGEGLREWLWLAWRGVHEKVSATGATPGRAIGLVGPTGGGKSTTLAKLASINRHESRQKNVIATLDATRYGAIEQWRRLGLLMNVEVRPIINDTDLSGFMEGWGSWDWVGIDTPGGLSTDSPAGRLYGSLLARCPIETLLILPATQRESLARRQMDQTRSWGARRVIFTKLDETDQTGSIVNLTMESPWSLGGFYAGTPVPQDLELPDAPAMWRRVLGAGRQLPGEGVGQ